MPTSRDRVMALALRLGASLNDRGYLREFGPETVSELADQTDVEVSTRTIRRVLESMSELELLEDQSSNGKRLYRLDPSISIDKSVNDTELSRDDRQICQPKTPLAPTNTDDRLILHLFADYGTEDEALSAYGRVFRVGLDPEKNRFSDIIRADALKPPLEPVFDLALANPFCQPWSPIARGAGVAEDYPKQIHRAREICRDLADHYIIENVPGSKYDPEGLREPDDGALVTLDGSRFGLPVPYERSFECSFPIEWLPPRRARDNYPRPPDQFLNSEGFVGEFRGGKALWRSIKHVSGDYSSRALVNTAVPAPYIHALAFNWLLELDDRDDRDETDPNPVYSEYTPDPGYTDSISRIDEEATDP